MCLEQLFGRQLQRVQPADGGPPSPDYTFTTAGGRRAAVEVKQITSPDWLKLQAGFAMHETSRTGEDLTMHRMVALLAEIAAARLTPTLGFPDDDGAQIAAFDAVGLNVVRKADRVAEQERQRDVAVRPIRVKGLTDQLVPELRVLERHGLTSTRGRMPTNPEAVKGWCNIARLTRGAICLASKPNPEAGMPAGVFPLTGYGYTRTGRADTVAERIQTWLETDATNLIQSLDHPEHEEKHAVLVFDGLEPELRSSEEAGSFLPERGLELPAPIDVLWAVLGSRVLRYDVAGGWSEYRVAVA